MKEYLNILGFEVTDIVTASPARQQPWEAQAAVWHGRSVKRA